MKCRHGNKQRHSSGHRRPSRSPSPRSKHSMRLTVHISPHVPCVMLSEHAIPRKITQYISRRPCSKGVVTKHTRFVWSLTKLYYRASYGSYSIHVGGIYFYAKSWHCWLLHVYVSTNRRFPKNKYQYNR